MLPTRARRSDRAGQTPPKKQKAGTAPGLRNLEVLAVYWAADDDAPAGAWLASAGGGAGFSWACTCALSAASGISMVAALTSCWNSVRILSFASCFWISGAI